ncbi:hypothetical protein TNCV_992391 [Trichonephila clavipes]|nr:hypothetical protein TNCV_992391 [Trichonephila clavipes]
MESREYDTTLNFNRYTENPNKVNVIAASQIRWLEHEFRYSDENPVKKITFHTPEGKRKRGRPRAIEFGLWCQCDWTYNSLAILLWTRSLPRHLTVALHTQWRIVIKGGKTATVGRRGLAVGACVGHMLVCERLADYAPMGPNELRFKDRLIWAHQ